MKTQKTIKEEVQDLINEYHGYWPYDGSDHLNAYLFVYGKLYERWEHLSDEEFEARFEVLERNWQEWY